MEYCLLCCVFSCCVVLSLVSALEMFEVPGHRGDIPRVVYISVERAYVGRVRMCSIFTIRVKFECSERLLLLYHFSIYGYTASHITLVII